MDIKTLVGGSYAVASENGCSVTCTVNGATHTLCDVPAGEQAVFVAMAQVTTISDDAAAVCLLPKSAPALGGGAGAYSPTHTKPLTSGSTTTLRNGGIYTIKQSELVAEAAAAVGKVRVDSEADQQFEVGGTLTIDNHTFVCKDESGKVLDFNADIIAIINADDTCAVSAAEAYPYMVLTAKTAGAAGNNIVLASDGGWPVEQAMSGGQDANDGSSIDLSGLSIGSSVTTAEIWIDCDGETAPDVALPTAWVWPNESNTARQPKLTAGKKHIFVVRNDGEVVIANLAQIY